MSSIFVNINYTCNFNASKCIKFDFKVHNFSSVKNVKSSELIIPYHDYKMRFCVVLVTTLDNIRIGLRRTDFSECDVEVSFFYKILNSSEKLYFVESIEKEFAAQKREVFFSNYVKRPVRLFQAKGLLTDEFGLSDNKLIVKGFLSLETCCTDTQNDLNRRKMINHNANLKELSFNMREMYLNHCFTDVVFYFGKSELKAHKEVLSTSSPVFQRMFHTDMIEYRQNKVQITDIKKHVFDVFLIFLYSGTLEVEDFRTILSLYDVADKYQVNNLFQICRAMLEAEISDKTAHEILLSAYLHSDQDLQEKVCHYITQNMKSVDGVTTIRCNSETFFVSYSLYVLSI